MTSIRRLTSADVPLVNEMLVVFGKAFGDDESYINHPPDAGYHKGLLESGSLIAIAAMQNDRVIGGLVAYELKKFEQHRSEIYLYDLAVECDHRRQGVATALIEELKVIGRERGAYLIYVQADTEAEDEAAISLYSKLGTCERVLHFDIQL